MFCHQLISYSIAQLALIYPLLKQNLSTAIEPETQNSLSTLKSGDTVRIRTEEEKTWNKKGSAIASNEVLARTTS